MNKKIISIVLSITVFFIAIATAYFVFYNQPKNIVLNSVSNNKNVSQKLYVKKQIIEDDVLLSQFTSNLLPKYKINVNVKPMLVKDKFFAYTTVVNPENNENINAVDAFIDKENKTVDIIVYLNSDYTSSNSDAETKINYNLVTGLLHADNQLQDKPELIKTRPELLKDSQAIFLDLLKLRQHTFITYEQ